MTERPDVSFGGGAPRWSFTDRVVIVLNASEPRGRAQVAAFTDAGATVVTVDHEHPALAVDRTPPQRGVARTIARVDEDEIAGVASFVEDRFGTLDILVLNGTPVESKALIEMDEADWDSVIFKQLTGTFLWFKHLVPIMIPARKGKVIVSTGPETAAGVAGQTHLCAARHAIFGLVKGLACEQGQNQINVNVVCPGLDVDDLQAEGHAAALAELTDNVMWLASDASRFVTGTTLTINRAAG